MHESHPGGPGGDYRPQHRRAGQPDQPDQPQQPEQQPGDDWFRPQRGQPREPGPRDLPAVYGGRRSLPVSRPLSLPVSRPPDRPLDRPRFSPLLRVTSVDLVALMVHEERKPGLNWALIVGTAFFLADTMLMAEGFTRPVPAASRVLVIFVWLISVAAAVLLWLRGSAKFSGFLHSPKFPGLLNKFSRFLYSRQSARRRRAH